MGYVIVASLAGAVRVGAISQCFWNDRAADHGESEPSEATARTCHQYVPFGTALLIVAWAFLVKKWSKFEPSTGELNPESAEISNS